MKIHCLTLGILFLLTFAVNIHAASFDCSKATSEVEKLICGDDELSKLDDSLNTAYLLALERPDIKKPCSPFFLATLSCPSLSLDADSLPSFLPPNSTSSDQLKAACSASSKSSPKSDSGLSRCFFCIHLVLYLTNSLRFQASPFLAQRLFEKPSELVLGMLPPILTRFVKAYQARDASAPSFEASSRLYLSFEQIQPGIHSTFFGCFLCQESEQLLYVHGKGY